MCSSFDNQVALPTDRKKLASVDEFDQSFTMALPTSGGRF